MLGVAHCISSNLCYWILPISGKANAHTIGGQLQKVVVLCCNNMLLQGHGIFMLAPMISIVLQISSCGTVHNLVGLTSFWNSYNLCNNLIVTYLLRICPSHFLFLLSNKLL